MSHLLLTASDPDNIKHCTALPAAWPLTSHPLSLAASPAPPMVRMMSAFPASAQVTSLVWMSLVLSGTQEGSFTTPWIGDSRPQRRVVIKFSCRVSSSDLFEYIHSLTTPSSKVKEYIISLIGICVFDSDSSEGSNNKQLNISFSSIDHLFTCLSDQTGFDI